MSVLLLWYAITTVTPSMQAETAASCMKLAVYAYEQLKTVKACHPDFLVEKGPQSLVVLFTRPHNDIFQKFQLSGRGEFARILHDDERFLLLKCNCARRIKCEN